MWIFNSSIPGKCSISKSQTIVLFFAKYVVAIAQVNAESFVIKYFIDASHSEKWNLFVLHYFFYECDQNQ